MASCQEQELVLQIEPEDTEFRASIEAVDATRTVMDENHNVLWSEGDQIVIFKKTTIGNKYQIKDQYVGTTTGGFSKITETGNDDNFESGNEIYHNVAMYPYSTSIWCMKNDNNIPTTSYQLNVVLPDTQTYAEDSFANGAFPMVAVSTDNQLTFRNICGGLKLQFKGVDKIKSIKIESIAGEAVSGKSTIIGYADGSAPTITMASTASSSVTLDCGEGVQLYENVPTTFIISLPPVTFRSGMRMTVTDTDGLSRTLTNSSANTIIRSSLLTFPAISYKQEGVFEIPEGALTSYEILAEGGTVEIPITTNQDYEVVIPQGAGEWITLVQTKALREETIALNIASNNTVLPRSAEVLIMAAGGETLQSISIAQAGLVMKDYVDEYGTNYGPGHYIGGTIWAPVNCGYHPADYKYGKYYQWGRKYGQGYSGNESDATSPIVVEDRASLEEGQSVSNKDKYYKYSNTGDWLYPSDDRLWNGGNEDKPIKTEYDPCPIGWRVPTYAEAHTLGASSMGTNELGQTGVWFNGKKEYSESDERIFLPLGGRWTYFGYAEDRGSVGYYWTSRPISGDEAYYLLLYSSYILLDDNIRMYGCSVRCVQDNAEVEPASSLSIDKKSLKLLIGQSDIITATITPSFYDAVWTSDTPSVATVDHQSGKVTAVAKGTAIITASAGGVSASCTVTVSDTPDYIDEYGKNHGQGVLIDNVYWAPVNCGQNYSYEYGKLYQWGRKYGQGYDGRIDEYGSISNTYTDPGYTVYETGGVSPEIANSESKSDVCFNSFACGDWTSPQDNTLWNAGTSDEPIKTEYDPCPEGWRVPTAQEMRDLARNHSEFTHENRQRGRWFSGSKPYSANVPSIFLSATGQMSSGGSYIKMRGVYGIYWTSEAYYDRNDEYYKSLAFQFNNSDYDFMGTTSTTRATCNAVRCVHR